MEGAVDDCLVDKADAYAGKSILMMNLVSVGLKDFLDQDIRLGLGLEFNSGRRLGSGQDNLQI
ncbi:hypothetical protein ACFL7M_15755 [Thermodesulfobacteriota bacterium]